MKSVEFKNIIFSYNKDKVIFNNVSFKIDQPSSKGYVVGLVGNSGSGKSTLFKLLLGINSNYKGEISLYPSDPVISYVPQEPVLFDHLTPFENATYFSKINNYKQYFNKELFDELAIKLQIDDILRSAKSVNEISGGQRQRISLLRALSIRPDILLLDEPLTGLDEEVKDTFLQTIATLVEEFNLLVIYITHHKKEVEFITDEILYLITDSNGTVEEIKQLKTDDFFETPPTLSALNSIKDLTMNVLSVENKDGFISICKSHSPNPMRTNYSISFDDIVIHFSNDMGYTYREVHSTPLFVLLELIESGSFISIKKEKYQQSKYIFFRGKIYLYDCYGRFICETEINNNQIFYING